MARILGAAEYILTKHVSPHFEKRGVDSRNAATHRAWEVLGGADAAG